MTKLLARIEATCPEAYAAYLEAINENEGPQHGLHEARHIVGVELLRIASEPQTVANGRRILKLASVLGRIDAYLEA